MLDSPPAQESVLDLDVLDDVVDSVHHAALRLTRAARTFAPGPHRDALERVLVQLDSALHALQRAALSDEPPRP